MPPKPNTHVIYKISLIVLLFKLVDLIYRFTKQFYYGQGNVLAFLRTESDSLSTLVLCSCIFYLCYSDSKHRT